MIQRFFLNRQNAATYSRLDHMIAEIRKASGQAVIAALFLLTHSELVQAATYYVATTGGDSNNGTRVRHRSDLSRKESAFSPRRHPLHSQRKLR